MKIVIIDDEIGAREILESLINRFYPNHEIVGLYPDLMSGVAGIKANAPNLVFLDIEMPRYAGYEIVDFFDEINFKIVFVTAYNHYAVHAFEVSALDYILKPIEVERLKSAVQKVEDSIEFSNYKMKLDALSNTLRKSDQKISFLNKGYREYLLLNDIIALNADGAYTKIYSKSKDPIIVSKNIKRFEEEFDGLDNFVRVHRSWIINKDLIVKISKTNLTVIMEGGVIAKLSRKNSREISI